MRAAAHARRGEPAERLSDASSSNASSRPRRPTGGRWFRTPPTCRASARSCSAPTRRGRSSANCSPPSEREPVPASQRSAPQYPWHWSAGVLAGLFGTFGMHSQPFDQVAGPAEMTPVVEFHEALEVVRQRHRHQQADARDPRRRHRACSAPTAPARPRCCNSPPASSGPARARCACSGQQAWNNPALNRFIGLCPEQDAFYEWMTGWDFVHTCARLSGLAAARRATRPSTTLDAVGMTPTPGPRDPRLLEGDAAADQDGPGAGPRPRRAVPRRAVHRHRPGRPPRPDGHHPAAGRRGKERARLQPRAARGAVADAEHRAAEPRPAGGRGARPRDSRPDRQASAPHRAGLRRVPAARRPRARVGRRRGRARAGRARAA